eukprot:9478228-Pyramimonas_sp.AAC.1
MGVESSEREDDDLCGAGSKAMQNAERRKGEDLHTFAQAKAAVREGDERRDGDSSEDPGRAVVQGSRLIEHG